MPCGYCGEEGHNRTTCPRLEGLSLLDRKRATETAQQERVIEENRRRNRMYILQTQQHREREQQRQEQARIQRERQDQELREQRERDERERQRLETIRRRRVQWCVSTLTELISHYADSANLEDLFNETSSPHDMLPLIGHRATAEIMLNNYHKIKTSGKQLVEQVSKPTDTTECPICIEKLTETDLIVTRCGHSFHSGCLLKHLNRNDNCPCCRGVII